jgi:hypothetical protein
MWLRSRDDWANPGELRMNSFKVNYDVMITASVADNYAFHFQPKCTHHNCTEVELYDSREVVGWICRDCDENYVYWEWIKMGKGRK